jgi:hypothetical protein
VLLRGDLPLAELERTSTARVPSSSRWAPGDLEHLAPHPELAQHIG